MDFVIQWLWYLLAFVAGSAVAWVIVTISIRSTAPVAVRALVAIRAGLCHGVGADGCADGPPRQTSSAGEDISGPVEL
jgi:hypothetical protein